MKTTCIAIRSQLVESARGAIAPDAAVRVHIAVCSPCQERWDAERGLTGHLRGLRLDAARRRAPDSRRQALMQRFAEDHRKTLGFPRVRWVWSLAAAAVLLAAVVAGRHTWPAPVPAADVRAAMVDDSADSTEAGFIPVPYVPPLATGEIVRVVHTELYPAALATLGVNVDPSWTTELPADLLIGQDGFPRAVRVADGYSQGGF